MKEKTIYDLPEMELKAYQKSLIQYIEFLSGKHRATREALLKEGKTYRSRFVAQENGYLNALEDIKDNIKQPGRNAELQQKMNEFAKRLKG